MFALKLGMRLSIAIVCLTLCSCTGDDTVGSNAGGKADDVGSFEEFLAGLYCEPNTDVCIVQGDIPIVGEEALRRLYAQLATGGQALSVMTVDDVDTIWDPTKRYELTYCVSEQFGGRSEQIKRAMREAAQDWEAVAHVRFAHSSAEDPDCTEKNNRVIFDVAPSPPGAYYFARAFFPSYERKDRHVYINSLEIDDAVKSDRFGGKLNLRGILRHELGHVLGFRHEHIRPENAGNFFCHENPNFRPLTEYDSRSVMHYPQCDGEGDWGLDFTEMDREGGRFFYPDFDKYQAARCSVELTPEGYVVDDCEPIAHEIIELANTASFDVLDNWVRLDRRAVEEIVEIRKTNPFSDLNQLRDEVRYLGNATVRKMYDYLYVNGRCPNELDSEGRVDVQCRPVTHRILELANTAPTKELDDDVGLDSRAVANIAAIRTYTPFVSVAELWAIPYVKTEALRKMYDFLYAK